MTGRSDLQQKQLCDQHTAAGAVWCEVAIASEREEAELNFLT
jgi:hypothetical protein